MVGVVQSRILVREKGMDYNNARFWLENSVHDTSVS